MSTYSLSTLMASSVSPFPPFVSASRVLLGGVFARGHVVGGDVAGGVFAGVDFAGGDFVRGVYSGVVCWGLF